MEARQPPRQRVARGAGREAGGFLGEELALRASPAYPPATGLVSLVASGRDETAVGRVAAETAGWAAALAERHGLELTVLGPAPCPLARIKERWRWHVALKGDGSVVGRVVRYAATRLAGSGEPRVTIDRDPVSLL